MKNISIKLFVSGGFAPTATSKEMGIKLKISESETLLRAISLSKYPNLKVYSESKSSNTLENVTEMMHIPEFKNCRSILFVFKAHAAGRGYLTLRKFFPNITILQKSFNTRYKQTDKELSKNNWYTFDFGRRRVWGEFLRIKKYGSRGDIAFDEVKNLVKQIEQLTGRRD